VFATRGFQAAAIEEIARRAEVAVATLYKLFGGKEEMFAAVVAFRQDEFLAEIERQLGEVGSPPERLDRLVRRIFAYFERHRQAFRIYLGATHGFPWHIRSGLGEESFARYRRFVGVIENLLRDGMKDGSWPAGDAGRLAAALVGAVNNLLTLRHTGDEAADSAEDVRFAEVVLRRLVGVVADAAAPSAVGSRGRRK